MKEDKDLLFYNSRRLVYLQQQKTRRSKNTKRIGPKDIEKLAGISLHPSVELCKNNLRNLLSRFTVGK